MSAPVVVVGAGIAGLAAAWEASCRGAEVTVYEASDRVGGKALTTLVGGRPVDCGPDAFLARVPDALALCRELGLEDELVPQAPGDAAIWSRGRMHPLPAGLVVGVPTLRGLVGVARSGLLPGRAMARAAMDVVLPRSSRGDDPSVGALVRARFGDEVADRLVDPLLGGIHAGTIDHLSVAATVPQLASVRRSVLLGLRAQPRPEGALFYGLRSGMQTLADRLGEALRERGVRIETQAPVASLPEGVPVVVATPAGAAARLVEPGSPEAAAELRGVRHASVVVVTFGYPALPLYGSGFLVPRVEGKLATACSFGSNKWPHWAEPERAVVRVSAGRLGDDRALSMSDHGLAEVLHRELAEMAGIRRDPLEVRVTRWPDGFPQYEPGHLDRVARIEAALARDLPGVQVAGAALRGVGLPACIGSGRAAGARAAGTVPGG